MESVLQDIRFSIRTLIRNPGATVTFLLVMALGIGATTAVLSVVDGVLLRPFSASNPDRLVTVGVPLPTHIHDPLTWWSQGQCFEYLAQYWSGGASIGVDERAERVSVAVVSANFFSVFGVGPQVGRPFLAEDETPGQNRVAVLSDSFWRRSFGGDPNVIGQKVKLNEIPHTIVGILAPRFSYPGGTEVWVPRALGDADSFLDLGSAEFPPAAPVLRNAVVGRLKAGVDIAQARAEINALFLRLQQSYPELAPQFGEGVSVYMLRELLTRDLRVALLMLFGGGILLLLISCANAMNILLAQAAVRQKEVAIRLCLGADRVRVLRQFLTESLLLTVTSGFLGILLAHWGVEAILAIGPKEVTNRFEVYVDPRTLGFACLASIAVGLVVGLVPAAQALSPNLAKSLKEGTFASRLGLGRRARVALVIGEVSLTFVLLAGAGLTARSLLRLLAIEPGFDTKNALTMHVALSKTKYLVPENPIEPAPRRKAHQGTGAVSPARVFQVYRQILDETRSVPGVVSVGAASELPLSGTTGRKLWFGIGGMPTNGTVRFSYVTEDYFRSMGIPLVRGRPFFPEDTNEAPRVAIVNQAFVRNYLAGANPLTQRITLWSWEGPWREIVGVTQDVRDIGLGEPAQPQIYLPALQPWEGGNGLPPLDFVLIARTSAEPSALSGLLRERVLAVDKDLPVFRVRTLDEVVAESLSHYSFRGALLGFFSFSALLLALVGVYGVVHYTVVCRTHEIGVRMVLGAHQNDILVMIFRQAAVLALVGVLIGGALTLALGRFVASLLFGLKFYDPLTIGVSSFVIVVGVLGASTIPALRASRLEPASLIRYE